MNLKWDIIYLVIIFEPCGSNSCYLPLSFLASSHGKERPVWTSPPIVDTKLASSPPMYVVGKPDAQGTIDR